MAKGREHWLMVTASNPYFAVVLSSIDTGGEKDGSTKYQLQKIDMQEVIVPTQPHFICSMCIWEVPCELMLHGTALSASHGRRQGTE